MMETKKNPPNHHQAQHFMERWELQGQGFYFLTYIFSSLPWIHQDHHAIAEASDLFDRGIPLEGGGVLLKKKAGGLEKGGGSLSSGGGGGWLYRLPFDCFFFRFLHRGVVIVLVCFFWASMALQTSLLLFFLVFVFFFKDFTWGSCVCIGFMLCLTSGRCAWWSSCFHMSFIVGMVLFIGIWPLRRLGLVRLHGFHALSYVRPLRLVELVFSHEFHRWGGVVFWYLAVAPAGTRAFAWVSCFVLRFLRGFFSPEVLCKCFLQRFFLQKFLCRCCLGRFFLHKFLCQYFHLRFFSRSFSAHVFFEDISPDVFLQISFK